MVTGSRKPMLALEPPGLTSILCFAVLCSDRHRLCFLAPSQQVSGRGQEETRVVWREEEAFSLLASGPFFGSDCVFSVAPAPIGLLESQLLLGGPDLWALKSLCLSSLGWLMAPEVATFWVASPSSPDLWVSSSLVNSLWFKCLEQFPFSWLDAD